MKKYLIAGLIVGAVILGIYLSTNGSKFSISDRFTDSTEGGKFTYLLVETNSRVPEDMLKWSKEIKMKDNILSMPDKTKPALITIYFYNPMDTIILNDDIRNSLKKRYTKTPEMVDKVNFVKDGWQYIGHNSIIITSVPKDSIFKTLVFVPKPGYKVKDIINLN